jgi:hypothetical protein
MYMLISYTLAFFIEVARGLVQLTAFKTINFNKALIIKSNKFGTLLIIIRIYYYQIG